MDDVHGEFITSIVAPTIMSDWPLNEGMSLSVGMELDAAAALHQEQQFHHELTLPNEALQSVLLSTEEVCGTKTDTAGLNERILRREAASGDDTPAQLHALAARNAYLTMSLETAAAEIAARKSESQQLYVDVAKTQSQQLELQIELADWRQRHEKTLSELGAARAQVQRLEVEICALAKIQTERDELQRNFAATREDAENRIAATTADAQSEIADLRSRLGQNEAERMRLDEGLLAAAADRRRMEEECKRLESQVQRARMDLDQLRGRGTRQSDPLEVKRLRARAEAQSENRQRYAQEMAAARKRIVELEALCGKLKVPPGAA
jgi:chromosome segregation ATPase